MVGWGRNEDNICVAGCMPDVHMSLQVKKMNGTGDEVYPDFRREIHSRTHISATKRLGGKRFLSQGRY